MGAAPTTRSRETEPFGVDFVSDVPTPHVNELLRAIVRRGVRLHAWYASETYPGYAWTERHAHSVVRATIFGQRFPSVTALRHLLLSRDEVLLLVGWSNPTTRVLVPLLATARRRFAFYMDLPEPDHRFSYAGAVVRRLYLSMLRPRADVLAVGGRAVEYLLARGFRPERVHNLPLSALRPGDLKTIRAARDEVRGANGVAPGDLFLASGSRLIRSKGYDLVLRALARLEKGERARVKFLLVGTGPEEVQLRDLARDLGLRDTVHFEPWLEIDDYMRRIAAADVVLHPARFDAYGGPSLTAVSLGVPVLGSTRAGSAVEIVEPGVNGWLYEPEDVDALTGHLRALLAEPRLVERATAEQRARSERWSPDAMAERLLPVLRSVRNDDGR